MNWQIAPWKLQWNTKKINQSNRSFERLSKNDRGNDLRHTMRGIRKGMVGWQSGQGKWWQQEQWEQLETYIERWKGDWENNVGNSYMNRENAKVWIGVVNVYSFRYTHHVNVSNKLIYIPCKSKSSHPHQCKCMSRCVNVNDLHLFVLSIHVKKI